VTPTVEAAGQIVTDTFEEANVALRAAATKKLLGG
jgi:hypothetical protein